ncbi:MAG: citrate/2-methylcitrate synthase [Ruminococcus sp.]
MLLRKGDAKVSSKTNLSLYSDFEKRNSVDSKYYNKYSVKRGLRNADGTGVMAGVTNICNVHGYVIDDGEKIPAPGELHFRGYNIKDLVENCEKEGRYGFEEVAYLLLTGDLPTKSELSDFSRILSDNRQLPDNFFGDMILKAPSKDIMNKLARSVLVLYSYDSNAEELSAKHEIDTAVSLLAKLPVIMVLAYYVKLSHFCGGSLVLHHLIPNQSTCEMILSILRPDRKYTPEEAKILDIMLMLHAEHGGGNNSTFSCRVLSSSGTDPYSAYAAAIGSLKGPKHGGANMKVVEMQKFIRENLTNWEDKNELKNLLCKIVDKEAFDKSGLIYGMGHAVYTLSDPRAEILRKYAGKMAQGTKFEKEFRLLESVEELAPQVIAERKGDSKSICANVDMYSGFVYRMLGIPKDLYTPLFAVSRMAGWAAHRFEELVSGKRIIRPAYKSVFKNRDYTPIDER